MLHFLEKVKGPYLKKQKDLVTDGGELFSQATRRSSKKGGGSIFFWSRSKILPTKKKKSVRPLKKTEMSSCKRIERIFRESRKILIENTKQLFREQRIPKMSSQRQQIYFTTEDQEFFLLCSRNTERTLRKRSKSFPKIQQKVSPPNNLRPFHISKCILRGYSNVF